MKQTIREYLRQIAKSSIEIREQFEGARQCNRCLTTRDLNHACECQCGEGWEYNTKVDACVNKRLPNINKLLYKEGSTIGFDASSIDTTTLDDSLRGFWGTDIDADNKIDMQSDNAQTVMGSDPARPMTSGYGYARAAYGNHDPASIVEKKKPIIILKV